MCIAFPEDLPSNLLHFSFRGSDVVFCATRTFIFIIHSCAHVYVCMCAHTHTFVLVRVHMLLSLSLTQFKNLKSVFKTTQCPSCWALRISFHRLLRCFWQSPLLMFGRRLVVFVWTCVFTDAEAVIWRCLQLFWTFYWIGFADLAGLVPFSSGTPVVGYRCTLLCLAFWLWCQGLNSSP